MMSRKLSVCDMYLRGGTGQVEGEAQPVLGEGKGQSTQKVVFNEKP
jgi:hypothetical protein